MLKAPPVNETRTQRQQAAGTQFGLVSGRGGRREVRERQVELEQKASLDASLHIFLFMKLILIGRHVPGELH